MDISMKGIALALAGVLAASASAQQASPEPTTPPATAVAASATPNAETAASDNCTQHEVAKPVDSIIHVLRPA